MIFNEGLEQIRSNSIKEINFGFNNIGDSGTIAIVDALKTNTSLTSINLWGSNIGASGAKAIADALKTNTTLATLNLGNNNIGDSGTIAIADALKTNTSLASLVLNLNNIGDSSTIAIADALKTNTSLASLYLCGNNIGASGAKAIADALKTNATLTTLELLCNEIGYSGGEDVADALKVNTALLFFYSFDNNVDKSLQATIDNKIATNRRQAEALITAVKAGDLTQVQQLIQAKASLHHKDNQGNTALHYAKVYGHQAIINYLLSQSTQNTHITTVSPSVSTLQPIKAGPGNINNKFKKLFQHYPTTVSPSVSTFQPTIKNNAFKNNNQSMPAKKILPLLQSPKSTPLPQTLPVQPIILPQPEIVVNHSQPYVTPTPSWHFSAEMKAQLTQDKKSYQLLKAGPEDINKVKNFYQHHPVPGMGITNIQIIYNPQLNRGFESRLFALQGRKDSTVFKPTWEQGENDTLTKQQWRKHIHFRYLDMAKPYIDKEYADVKLLPLWHGTDPAALESIFKTGYANLAYTDSGFFGKGIYSTHEAEYAYRVYSKGALIVNWVASFSAFPTIDGDMMKLTEKGNYKNYDAHFVPVVPKTPHPQEVNYYPTQPNQKPTYTEMVVFESVQCLPRYLVELGPELTQAVSIGTNLHSLFNKKMVITSAIDLHKAAQYVYTQYLAKPYTLTMSTDGKIDFTQVDWNYRYGNVIVQRPNHGLAHTLRTAYYVEKVMNYYIDYNKHLLSPSVQKSLKESVSEIQLRLLFETVGRENEAARFQDEKAWDRFFANSDKAFNEYVKLNKIKLCYYGKPELDEHIEQIRRISHVLDLMRCLTTEQYTGGNDKKFEDKWCLIENTVGSENCKRLHELAYQCLISTGNRVIDYKKVYQHYEGYRFVKASQDVGACIQLINEGIKEWENTSTIMYSFAK